MFFGQFSSILVLECFPGIPCCYRARKLITKHVFKVSEQFDLFWSFLGGQNQILDSDPLPACLCLQYWTSTEVQLGKSLDFTIKKNCQQFALLFLEFLLLFHYSTLPLKWSATKMIHGRRRRPKNLDYQYDQPLKWFPSRSNLSSPKMNQNKIVTIMVVK